MSSNNAPDPADDDLWASFEAAFGESAPAESQTPQTESTDADVPPGKSDDSAHQDSDISDLMAKLESMAPIRTSQSAPEASVPEVSAPTPEMPAPPAPVAFDSSALPSLPSSAGRTPFLPASSAHGEWTVRLELTGSRSLKVGHKAALSLLLHTPSSAARYDLLVMSDLLEVPVGFEGACAGAHACDVGSLKFVPDAAGDEEFRFEVTLADAAGVPAYRYTGTIVLNVESTDGPSIQAGGDVIMIGGRSNLDIGLDADLGGSRDVPLLLDQAFAERLARTLPAAGKRAAMLPVAEQFRFGLGALYTRDANGDFCCQVVRVADAAAMGRGGANHVCWWVRPVPDSGELASRMSRHHITIQFASQRAWLVDHSANGSQLNGQTVCGKRPIVIADGDVVRLAGALELSVHLFSNGQEVSAVELRRRDQLADSMVFLLVKPGCSHPLCSGAPDNSVAWTENGSMKLQLPTGEWDNLQAGEEHDLPDGTTVAWHEIGDVIDQDQLL